jgi:hypothetical protein
MYNLSSREDHRIRPHLGLRQQLAAYFAQEQGATHVHHLSEVVQATPFAVGAMCRRLTREGMLVMTAPSTFALAEGQA